MGRRCRLSSPWAGNKQAGWVSGEDRSHQCRSGLQNYTTLPRKHRPPRLLKSWRGQREQKVLILLSSLCWQELHDTICDDNCLWFHLNLFPSIPCLLLSLHSLSCSLLNCWKEQFTSKLGVHYFVLVAECWRYLLSNIKNLDSTWLAKKRKKKTFEKLNSVSLKKKKKKKIIKSRLGCSW